MVNLVDDIIYDSISENDERKKTNNKWQFGSFFQNDYQHDQSTGKKEGYMETLSSVDGKTLRQPDSDLPEDSDLKNASKAIEYFNGYSNGRKPENEFEALEKRLDAAVEKVNLDRLKKADLKKYAEIKHKNLMDLDNEEAYFLTSFLQQYGSGSTEIRKQGTDSLDSTYTDDDTENNLHEDKGIVGNQNLVDRIKRIFDLLDKLDDGFVEKSDDNGLTNNTIEDLIERIHERLFSIVNGGKSKLSDEEMVEKILKGISNIRGAAIKKSYKNDWFYEKLNEAEQLILKVKKMMNKSSIKKSVPKLFMNLEIGDSSVPSAKKGDILKLFTDGTWKIV